MGDSKSKSYHLKLTRHLTFMGTTCCWCLVYWTCIKLLLMCWVIHSYLLTSKISNARNIFKLLTYHFFECFSCSPALKIFVRMFLSFSADLNFFHYSVFQIPICILITDVNVFYTWCGGNTTSHKYDSYIIHSYHDWQLNRNFHASQQMNHEK